MDLIGNDHRHNSVARCALLVATSLGALLAAGCGGGAGDGIDTPTAAALPAPPPTPIAVYPTSYENAKRIFVERGVVELPNPSRLELPGATWFWASAYADFFQEGQLSAVAFMAQYSPKQVAAGLGAPDLPSKVYFLRRNAQGQWFDATSQVLGDTTGCVTPRKALVADFNGDGKPDVFIACHGYDGPVVNDDFSVWGERQRILLSTKDGSYRNVELPVFAYGHGASAADLDGDGNIDIVLVNPSSGPSQNPQASSAWQPLALMNKGDGSFTIDLNRMPTSWQYAAIYTFELIDVQGNGKPDLFAGAFSANATGQTNPGSGSLGAVWVPNDGHGRFLEPLSLPNPADSVGFVYDLPQDFLFDGHRLFVTRTAIDYEGVAVQQVKLSDLTASVVYSHQGPYSDGGTWFSWTRFAPDGSIRPLMSSLEFPSSDPRWANSAYGVIIAAPAP